MSDRKLNLAAGIGVVLACLLGVARAEREQPVELVGTWTGTVKVKGANVETILTLNGDGQAVWRAITADQDVQHLGKWCVKDKSLQLVVKDQTLIDSKYQLKDQNQTLIMGEDKLTQVDPSKLPLRDNMPKDGKRPAELVGTWHGKTDPPEAVEVTLTFAADGKLTTGFSSGGQKISLTGRWYVQDGLLHIRALEDSEPGKFKVDGDKLWIGDAAQPLEREGANTNPSGGAVAVNKGPLGPGEVEDKVTGIHLPAVTIKPLVICGYVVDSSGKPIPEELGKVRVHAWTRGLHGEAHINAVPDEKGYYEMKVEDASWYVDATVKIMKDQQMWVLDLRPVQTRTNQWPAEKGARLDFVWSLSGVRPDKAGIPKNSWEFYGMSLKMSPQVYPEVAGTYVFELTPQGKLMDGSEAKKIHREWKIKNLAEDVYVYDVPLGTYIVEGWFLRDDGKKVMLKMIEKGDQWWDRMEVSAEGSTDDGRLQGHYVRVAPRDAK